MNSKLKSLRAAAGLTQKKVAAAVGVSQPNYQRWESGMVPVPQDKVEKLAAALGTSADAIVGRYVPIEVHLVGGRGIDDAHVYYGEVAIHFKGGGKPLLVSISDAVFSELHRDLQGSEDFVCFRSLANQSILLHAKAVSDLYFSSEAYDDFGPEHETYDRSGLIQMVDPKFWSIIACFAFDDEDSLDFDDETVQAVMRMLGISKTAPANHPANDDASSGEAGADGEDEERRQRILDLASKITYQLSNGTRRNMHVFAPEELYDDLYHVFEFTDQVGDEMLRLDQESSHRIAFVNPHALDYLTVPTHLFERGAEEAFPDLIEEAGNDDPEPAAAAKGTRGRGARSAPPAGRRRTRRSR